MHAVLTLYGLSNFTNLSNTIIMDIPSLYELFKNHPHISTDSRAVIPNSIFFSLKGPSFNGNKFAGKALELGAAVAVVDEAVYKNDERIILVEDALKSLQQLANYHRRRLKIPFLAITGSNGKTTTKELVRIVLSKKYVTLATKGNLNNHIGVPLTILSITPDIRFAIIEMGANHLHEIESYCTIADPDYGLITNIGKAHLEGFGGYEGVKSAKGELYKWLSKKGKAVFINNDNADLKDMAVKADLQNTVTYGKDENGNCTGILVSRTNALNVKWKYNGSDNRQGETYSRLIGDYNFENILAAICIGNYFGVRPEEINTAIAEYVPDNSRSQLVQKNTNSIILDAYNANPTSMEAAIKNFSVMKDDRKIICIGDMAELGTESAREHERIVEMLKEINAEEVILVGDNFGLFASRLKSKHFQDSQKAADWVKQQHWKNKWILIKGSRSTKMEKIFDAI
jgi:UDP-N-acetylmuramoyl-tripeptide--D-alanyl-D-alanine ligase